MRIGFDARAVILRGGIGTYSRSLLREFAESGVEVVVFCEDQAKESIPKAPSFTLVSANMDLLAPHARGAFKALVREAKVDLLHAPSPWTPAPEDIPLVSTVHDIAAFLYRGTYPPVVRMRYKQQFKRAVETSRRVITVSQILCSALGVYAGIDPTKVRVIHNGVAGQFRPETDSSVLAAARTRHSLPDRYVFWAGDFRPEKNLVFLIQAWGRLRGRLADLPVLVMAGRARGDYRRVMGEVRRHHLEDLVMFPGFIPDDDLPAVYSAATAFVFPSLYEGFGLPPLEAMACGTPCVVSNSSSLPEVTGSAAMLFNPTSLESFEGCVMRVLTEPELRASLGEAGLKQSALFPWSKAAEETLEVYREVLEEAETPPAAA